jgi:hypothetical protein
LQTKGLSQEVNKKPPVSPVPIHKRMDGNQPVVQLTGDKVQIMAD